MMKKIKWWFNELDRIGYVNVVVGLLGLVLWNLPFFMFGHEERKVLGELFEVYPLILMMVILYLFMSYHMFMEWLTAISLFNINKKYDFRFRNYHYALKYHRKQKMTWWRWLITKYEYKYHPEYWLRGGKYYQEDIYIKAFSDITKARASRIVK